MGLSRILHAEDDEDIREIVQLSLEGIGGFVLLQCPDGPSAVKSAEGFKPDLLLLDYMMPEMSGEEAWHEILRIPGLEQVPAIFLTAKIDNASKIRLVQDGAAGFIAKPFDPVRLPDEIRAIWNKLGI